MKQRRSEIFELFEKIAEENGLTTKESKELKDYKNDPNPRAGSDDISTIEALYNVKPDGEDYDYNIVEKAHPNAVVVAPSYDRLNGLVENVNELNNIMINIVNKPTNGHLTNHKYAKKELLAELVRIANDLDNKNQEELRKLADNCIEKLIK